MNSSNASTLTDTAFFTIASTTINLILSLPTNSYVVWLIATGAGGTMVAEFLLLNLAVFDILFCLLSVCSFLRIFLPLKHLSILANSFLWSGRPILQCCICIEQFLAVVHPVLFLRYKQLRHKAAFSGVAWAVILVIIVTFVGTYLFWCVAIFSNLSNWFSHYRKILTRICTSIAFASGFVQPLLYLQKTLKCSCSKAV